MRDPIRWTTGEMIEETVAYWGTDEIREEDCRVVESTADGDGRECLVVLHEPTGRTSAEAGDQGRWTLDGVAWPDLDCGKP